MLVREGIQHHVLNAKNHEKEAEIIAAAGQGGAVTISTNMAGRGTDIKLGSGVAELGGLHVLGTERHESRRIDNQLRGRSGRQGDMGSSRFYLSLEDDLLRIFGADRIASIMDRIGFEEGQPIEHALISKAIENAQRRVEGQNFDIRKHLLEYDDVMNKQRQVIYEQRRDVLKGEDLWSMIEEMNDELVDNLMSQSIDEKAHPEEWNLKGLDELLYKQFGLKFEFGSSSEEMGIEAIREKILKRVTDHLKDKEQEFGKPLMDYLMKYIMLQSIDTQWKDHLLAMDHLKEGIGLRGYGQKDPIREYQREGYETFAGMIVRIKADTVEKLSLVRVEKGSEFTNVYNPSEDYVMNRGDAQSEPSQAKREGKKVGRNEPCPCGSGKKYKKCCGK